MSDFKSYKKNTYTPNAQVVVSGTNAPTVQVIPDPVIFALSLNRTVELTGNVPITVSASTMPLVSTLTLTLSTPKHLHPNSCQLARGQVSLFVPFDLSGALGPVATSNAIAITGKQLVITFTFPSNSAWLNLTQVFTTTMQLSFDITYTL